MKPQIPDGLEAEYQYDNVSSTFTGRAVNEDANKTHRMTTAVVGKRREDGTLDVFVTGQAICNEETDQFCRKIGRDIALGRALKQLKEKS